MKILWHYGHIHIMIEVFRVVFSLLYALQIVIIIIIIIIIELFRVVFSHLVTGSRHWRRRRRADLII